MDGTDLGEAGTAGTPRRRRNPLVDHTTEFEAASACQDEAEFLAALRPPRNPDGAAGGTK